MLLTDSILISDSDLGRVDSQAVQVAQQENIQLTGPVGLIQASQEDAMNELAKMVISFGGYLNSGDLSANHLAAVLNVGIGNSVRQKVGLQQIVVSGDIATQWSWIKRWMVSLTLMNLYLDASGRTTNDRYEKRVTMFKEQSKNRITPNIYQLGLPIITRPLVRPAAYFEANSGKWGPTNVSLVAGPGSTQTPVKYDVAVTYVDMSSYNFYVSASTPNNMESNPSDIVTQNMSASGNVIKVDVTSLNPPSGVQSKSQVLVVVVSLGVATHYNVYVGLSGETLYLQNSSPIPLATKTFTLPGDPQLGGFELGQGQLADRRLSLMRTRQRA